MPTRKLNGTTVLVVDCTKHNLVWIRLVLELEGATVFAAVTVSEALKVLDTMIVDVAITELRLPDVDGFELLRLIREGGSNENAVVPVIAMGAATVDATAAKATEAGFAAFLVKPLLAESIVDCVIAVIEP